MTAQARTLLLLIISIVQIFGAVQVRTSDRSLFQEKSECCGKACACEDTCGCIGGSDHAVPNSDQTAAVSYGFFETIPAAPAEYAPAVQFPSAPFTVLFYACTPSDFSASPPPEFHLPLRI